jgi:ADP-heptose:LPS heptosyltransferase
MDFKEVKRVLIYRLGSLGDTVVAVPALHLIERTFPAARRVLLTNMQAYVNAPAAFAIIYGSGLVHSSIDYPLYTRSPRQLAVLWWKIVRFRPQVVIYLMPRRAQGSLERDNRFFRLCGARQVVGLPIGDLAESAYDPTTQLWEHEGMRLLRCIASLGKLPFDELASWDLRLTPQEEQKGHDMLTPLAGRRLIACGPATKMQAKDWGHENWRSLLSRLSREFPDFGLILVGAEQDALIADYVGAGWRGPVLNLCGKLTPRETAAVVRHTELFLGPDSGPMHLAAAYGVSCAVPFAARQEPGKWYPAGANHRVVYHRVACWKCALETCIEKQKLCLTSITVDEMFAAALEAWKNGQTEPCSQLP